jgi:flagellar operon protein
MEEIQFKKNCAAFVRPDYAVNGARRAPAAGPEVSGRESEFARLVKQTAGRNRKLTFSRHALQRMETRGIQASQQLVSQLSGAVEKARAKGVKDALVLNGRTAFVVNVPSGTVVTTMNGGETAGTVFTNIDGAVVL